MVRSEDVCKAAVYADEALRILNMDSCCSARLVNERLRLSNAFALGLNIDTITSFRTLMRLFSDRDTGFGGFRDAWGNGKWSRKANRAESTRESRIKLLSKMVNWGRGGVLASSISWRGPNCASRTICISRVKAILCVATVSGWLHPICSIFLSADAKPDNCSILGRRSSVIPPLDSGSGCGDLLKRDRNPCAAVDLGGLEWLYNL